MIEKKRNYRDDDANDRLAREIIRENTGGKDPELALADDFMQELDARLEQVRVYFPIMEILRRRKPDGRLSKLVPELTFLLLSFLIYEGKLRNRGITFQNLEDFLFKALNEVLYANGSREDVKVLTAEMLDGLQNGGRNFLFGTYSLENGGYRERYVKFLEIRQSEDGTLQYHITEQGVDFYLKTKEFPEETKITVNLLLFQKQMEKGAFGFAYETVRRLNMEVQKKKDRKYSLLEALMYGRLDSGEAYNSYHRSIVLQFREESELFNTAMKNVRDAYGEYMERINDGDVSDKELRTFTLIKIIEREIGRAQTLHTELLKEAVSFTGEYDKALEVRRKAIFTERFNFEGEFEKLINQNAVPGGLKFLFEPMLSPKLRKSFNLLRAFEAQRLPKDSGDEENVPDGAEEGDRETADETVGRRVRENFVFYAVRLLKALDRYMGEVSLQTYCSDLAEEYSQDAVYNGDFISFILEMNRDRKAGDRSRVINMADGRIQVEDELKTIEEVFIKANLKAGLEARISRVTVKTFPEEELELLSGLKITKMLFTGEFKS